MPFDETTVAPEDIQAQLASARYYNFLASALLIAAAVGYYLGGAALRLPLALLLALGPPALIVLLRRWPMLYVIGKSRRWYSPSDPRTDLIFAFMASAFGLFLGMHDLHFAEIQMFLECAGLTGALFCLAVFAPARAYPHFWNTMLALLIFGGIYGGALTATADFLPDTSAPAYFATTVTAKFTSYHRGTHYHLVLAPWGPIDAPQDLTVPERRYDAVEIGGRVCAELHPGWLHVAWYRLADCGDPSEP